MPDDMRKQFANPSKDYRSAPFWSWNGRMKPTEVRRQVRDMKAHGMGGFFMHSRVGLETPYMGPEWMRAIHAAVDEAKKIGMNAWLYDEDRWPSGTAGGMVPARGEECQQKMLVMHTHRKFYKPTKRTLCAFVVKMDTKNGRRDLLSARKVTGKAKPERGEVILSFSMEITPAMAWFNGYPYGDNMSATSVRALIETTYVPYVEALKEEIPDVVPGIFTDEPNISIRADRSGEAPAIPWTSVFVEEFRTRRGYDILDVLPHYFYDGKRSTKIRHDYWKTVTELFTQNFSKQLGDFCRKHGFTLTGHFNQEGSLLSQMRECGAMMPNYVWQDAPGIDILTEQRREYLSVKQVSSVASQFGRKTVLCEIYGCTGWEFTFEGMKWVGDWQYALGITLRCPHLALYTLRGCTKRDYPPSFNYNTTWWKFNHVHEDYFARLSVMMTQGTPVRDVLVIHPIASAWSEYDNSHSDGVQQWHQGFEETMRTLLGHHRDFDLGDETVLEDFASAGEGKLRVKKMSYPVVVLPPMSTMNDSTFRLLKKFLASGGHVVATDPVPTRIDALADARLKELWKHRNTTIVDSPADLPGALDEILPASFGVQSIEGQEIADVLGQLRRIGKKRVLFVCNTDRDAPKQAEIRIAEVGTVEEWDALTGAVREVGSVTDGKITRWPAVFGPAGSKLYVIDTAKKRAAKKVSSAKPAISAYPEWEWWADAWLDRNRHRKGQVFLGPDWKFRRTDPNVLTLDRCRWRARGGKLSAVGPLFQAQMDVRKKLGLRPNHDNGDIQRWRWVHGPADTGKRSTEYHFEFDVDVVPKGDVSLVLEGSELYTIKLNGKKVPARKTGWYLDHSMHKVRLPRLKVGKNKLVLACDTTTTMQTEDCFILGDFGVTPSRVITSEPETLHTGDWTMQGYTHYAGGIVYEAELDFDGSALRAHTDSPSPWPSPPRRGARGTRSNRATAAVLKLGKFSAVVTAIHVNGKLAGHIPWRSADGLDIAKFLKKGRNRVEIEVMGSPRNMLGPLHHAAGKPAWTGAGQFLVTGEEYTPDYILWPWGLMDQVSVTLYGN